MSGVLPNYASQLTGNRRVALLKEALIYGAADASSSAIPGNLAFKTASSSDYLRFKKSQIIASGQQVELRASPSILFTQLRDIGCK